jgi:transposase
MKNKAELLHAIKTKDQQIERLEEENRLLRKALFAPKSEKVNSHDESPQLPLFDMPENPPESDEEPEKKIVIKEHSRVKKGRKPIPEHLPRVEVVHDISDEEKICACGCQLSRIGEEVSEKLDVVPAKIQVVRHIRPKYACKECEGALDDGKSVRLAPQPPQILPKSLATAGLLSHVLTAKFCDALPFYRQEKQFARMGIDVARQTMCNWAMLAAEKCKPLLELLHKEVRSGPLINGDETTVQVLAEPGRAATSKSYMWVFRGGAPEKPVVVYQYNQGRSADVAKLFFDKYQGIVQTDGYKGYDFLDTWPGILHVGCWAHARRKFIEADKASGSKKNNRRAGKAISFIRKLYRLEKQAKDDKLDAAAIYEMRQTYARPILNSMKQWLDGFKGKVPPTSLLGKAVNYCLSQWHRLKNYIKDGNASIDNNVAENAIRPFVVGRKNWLFSGSPAGARASALFYSLIETAKANKLEPYSYLRFLFESLPVTPAEKLGSLLPNRVDTKDLILPEIVSGV